MITKNEIDRDRYSLRLSAFAVQPKPKSQTKALSPQARLP